MTKSDAQARVARGAALLDEHVPDWPTRIQLNRFDLSNPCECVIGQCFGHYDNGTVLDWFPASLYAARASEFDSVACGYDLRAIAATPDEWATLQAAWVDAIEARLIPPATWTHREPCVTQKATS